VREEVRAHSIRAMKLLLEGLLVALVLVAELVGLSALATRYATTTEAHPSEQGSLAIVVGSDDDSEAYQLVEWEPSSCGAWAPRSKSESSIEANSSSSESEAQEECRVHIRPHLATTRHPGVRPTDEHRPEPATSENSPSRQLGE
jgi:hypothetical protein